MTSACNLNGDGWGARIASRRLIRLQKVPIYNTSLKALPTKQSYALKRKVGLRVRAFSSSRRMSLLCVVI